MPILFGVRHLSPGGAHHLLRLLDEIRPELVLIEGPGDLSTLIPQLCLDGVKPPVAIMAYSETVPVRSILYPFAVYSPEYQAILWAHRNQKACRFIDLPSGTFLAMADARAKRMEESGAGNDGADDREQLPDGRSTGAVYDALARLAGEPDQEAYWERRFEHNLSDGAYLLGAAAYGRQLRETAAHTRYETAENDVREAYMKRRINEALAEGFDDDRIVVVTGAYHVAGLERCAPLSDSETAALPSLPAQSTLMPYSYYRLSSLSGYGAGNRAPAYYELLWDAIRRGGEPGAAGYAYLTRMAAYMRAHGAITSSAEVIEAVRLAGALAGMCGPALPVLQDLRDAAVACMGHGHFSEIAQAAADTEIGSCIGSLPDGVSRTAIQADFYRCLRELKLEKYKALTAQPLELDLRENTRVKSEQSAFLDLNRSFFLHRLRVLGVRFGTVAASRQDRATWAENWTLQWTPEAEIELVESALRGETIELAAAFAFKEQLEAAQSISGTASILEDAFLCGMPRTIAMATATLQGLAIDAAAVPEIAATAESLSAAVRFGSIRRLDPAPLLPILSQLFLRACLILPGSCACDNSAAGLLADAIGALNTVALNHADCVDEARWLSVLTDLSDRDDLNTKLSGFATAILLERGKITNELLSAEVCRRLSPGVPAELGAGWFEGLSMKNRYALIARLSLWEQLGAYIDTLDETEFKRALVFLRRAFADFSPKEKNEIAENLGEVWGVDARSAGEALGAALTEPEQAALDALDEFDFDDL